MNLQWKYPASFQRQVNNLYINLSSSVRWHLLLGTDEWVLFLCINQVPDSHFYAGFSLWHPFDALCKLLSSVLLLPRWKASDNPEEPSFFRPSVDQHDTEYKPSLVKSHQTKQKSLWSISAVQFTEQIIQFVCFIFFFACFFFSWLLLPPPSSCWTASWEIICTWLCLVFVRTFSHQKEQTPLTNVIDMKISYKGLKGSSDKWGVTILTVDKIFCAHVESDLQ